MWGRACPSGAGAGSRLKISPNAEQTPPASPPPFPACRLCGWVRRLGRWRDAVWCRPVKTVSGGGCAPLGGRWAPLSRSPPRPPGRGAGARPLGRPAPLVGPRPVADPSQPAQLSFPRRGQTCLGGPTGANQPVLIAWMTAVVRAGWPGPKSGCECSASRRHAKFRAVKPLWCPFCLGSCLKVPTPEGRGHQLL